MPTREEMIQFLEEKKNPTPPTREKMISFLESKKKADIEPENDEPGIGSQVLSGTMKGLDYLRGFGTMGAAGINELASLTGLTPSVSRPGDFTRALKGEAPTTSEYLDRAGMEDGALRTGIGFVGDIATDPATYATGGASAVAHASKLGKLKNIAKAAANIPNQVTAIPLQGVGKIYKSATRNAAPKIASAISGSDAAGLKQWIKNPDDVKRVAENVFENTDEAVNAAKSAILEKKTEIAGRMNAYMRDSDQMIDISGVKNKINNEIATLTEKKASQTGLSPQENELLNLMTELKKDAFSDIFEDGMKEIPDMIDANRMFDLKESLRRAKGTKSIFDAKTNMVKQVDGRFLKKSKDLYGDLNNAVDSVFTNAKGLRDEFAQVSDDFNFVNKRFKGDPVRPDTDTNALLRLSSGKSTKKIIDRIDNLYGSNLGQAGTQGRAAYQFADPSLIPQSGQGVVSTGRIAASSALGAQLLGDIMGTRGGAATGLIGGMLAASPAVMSRAGRGAYVLEKATGKLMDKIPAKPSIYRRMAIDANREE